MVDLLPGLAYVKADGTLSCKVAGDVPLTIPGSGAGNASATYEHSQPTPATVWTINHNLGFRPAIQAFGVGGREMVGEIIHISTTQVQIYFDSAVAGFARCN